MRLHGRLFGLCSLALTVTGCAAFSPADLAAPTELTVEKAMTNVGAGFAGMHEEINRKGPRKLGLYPCKVTVNFNVTASAAQGGTLVLSTSTAPTTTQTVELKNTVTADARIEQTNESSASRGNTVVVEMYSIPCTPLQTLAGQHPDKVMQVVRAANEGVGGAPTFRPAQSQFTPPR